VKKGGREPLVRAGAKEVGVLCRGGGSTVINQTDWPDCAKRLLGEGGEGGTQRENARERRKDEKSIANPWGKREGSIMTSQPLF